MTVRVMTAKALEAGIAGVSRSTPETKERFGVECSNYIGSDGMATRRSEV